MAARGVVSHWESLAGAGGNSYISVAGFSINMATTNIVITGWMRIKGTTTSDVRGQVPFFVFNGTDTGAMFFDSGGGGFDMRLKVFSGGETSYGSWTVGVNEDWFYVILWDSATTTWTAYLAKDGDSSIGSPASTAGGQATATLNTMQVAGEGAFNYDWGCNIEVTDVIVATPTTLPDSTALFAQMNSDSVTLSSPYLRLALNNSSDLTDTTGNGHNGSIVGTIADGSMDPVDIQTPSGGVVFRGLSIRH